VHVVLEDDIDGSEATETVSFALDGTSYEIDLNDQNAAALRDALAPYVGHARRAGKTRRGGGSTGASTSTSAGEIRAWARSNGYQVSDRGRVPQEIRDAYAAR
jgi:hypothetical protein